MWIGLNYFLWSVRYGLVGLKKHSFSIIYIIWPFQRPISMSINSKLGFLRVARRKYLFFFAIYKRLEIRIFECCSRLNSQIAQFRNRNLVFSNVGQIFPNSLKRFRKLGLLTIGQETSNEQEWMKVGSF